MKRIAVNSVVMDQKTSSEREKRFILFLLRLCFVHSSSDGKGRQIKNKIYSALCVFITFIHSVHLLSQIYVIGMPKTVTNLGFLIMYGDDLIFRYLICKHSSTIFNVVQHISRVTYSKEKRLITKFLIWAVSILGMLSAEYICSILAVIRRPERITTLLFGFKTDSEMLNQLILQVYTFLKILTIRLPIISFSILYSYVCFNLHRGFLSFNASMTSGTVPVYSRLLETFAALKNNVLRIDHKLSTLVFFSIVLNTGSLFLTYHMVFLDSPSAHNFGRAVILLTAVNSMMSLLMICTSASNISNLASKIAERARYLPEVPSGSDLTHIRFLMATDKEATMTVLGGIPINNTFALACLGTLVTYLALLDNLKFVK